MDRSLNKTRFQCVKLIFDSENKQFFPKKHVDNGVCKNNLTLCSRRVGKSQIFIIFRKKTVSEKAEIFRIFLHESIADGLPMICPWSAHDLPMIADENDGGRQHFIFFWNREKKLLNGKVKICIEKVKKMLKIFESSKMLKC